MIYHDIDGMNYNDKRQWHIFNVQCVEECNFVGWLAVIKPVLQVSSFSDITFLLKQVYGSRTIPNCKQCGMHAIHSQLRLYLMPTFYENKFLHGLFELNFNLFAIYQPKSLLLSWFVWPVHMTVLWAISFVHTRRKPSPRQASRSTFVLPHTTQLIVLKNIKTWSKRLVGYSVHYFHFVLLSEQTFSDEV